MTIHVRACPGMYRVQGVPMCIGVYQGLLRPYKGQKIKINFFNFFPQLFFSQKNICFFQLFSQLFSTFSLKKKSNLMRSNPKGQVDDVIFKDSTLMASPHNPVFSLNGHNLITIRHRGFMLGSNERALTRHQGCN